MNLYAVTSIQEYLEGKYEGYMLNLMYFLYGLAIGACIFLLTLLIVFLISKIRKGTKVLVDANNYKSNDEYKNIVEAYKKEYKKTYGKAGIKDSVIGLGNVMFGLFSDISKLYNPDSKEPIFEISIEKLSDFLGYFIHRIDYTIDGLIESKLHVIDSLTQYSIKDKKISFVFELFDGTKKVEKVEKPKKEKKPNIFTKMRKGFMKVVRKTATAVSKSIMDKEFIDIIDDLGEDANKLYSGQPLIFLDVSKRDKRIIKKLNLFNKKNKEVEETNNDSL